MTQFIHSLIAFVTGKNSKNSNFLLAGEEAIRADWNGSLPIIAIEDFRALALQPAYIVIKGLTGQEQYQLIERNGEIALLMPHRFSV